MIRSAQELQSTARFEGLGRLGQGGMGTVYAALDRERGTRIAIKSLSSSLPVMQAERLLLFKQEFRAIQDLHHPNLVQLGELFEVEGHWFFTMELLEGTDFMSFVRAAAHPPEALDETMTSDVDGLGNTAEPAQSKTGPRTEEGPRAAGFDETRLRSSLIQLASGLCALHAAGKVHRDIKPSSVAPE